MIRLSGKKNNYTTYDKAIVVGTAKKKKILFEFLYVGLRPLNQSSSIKIKFFFLNKNKYGSQTQTISKIEN